MDVVPETFEKLYKIGSTTEALQLFLRIQSTLGDTTKKVEDITVMT